MMKLGAKILFSFRAKLALAITLLVLLISVFVLLFFPPTIEDLQYSAIRDKIKSITQNASTSAAGGIYFNDFEAVEIAISPLLQDKEVSFVVVCNDRDSVIYSYNLEVGIKNEYNIVPENDFIERNEIIVFHAPSDIFNMRVGKLYLGYSLITLESLMSSMREKITFISVSIILLGILLALLIGRIVTGPLKNVVRTVNKIAEGDYSKRVPLGSRDEIGYLAESFNHMLEKIITANKQYEASNIELRSEITKRQKYEHELKENEIRFRAVFENASLGIFQLTEDGEILMANQALIKMLDLKETESLVGKLFEEYFFLEEEYKQFIKYLNPTGVIGFGSQWRKNNGEKIFVRISLKKLLNEEKHSFVGTVEDITENKQAELELTENEYRYRTLFNISPSGIVLENKDGTIIDTNTAFCKLTGFTREELLGQNVRIFADPDYYNAVEANIKRILSGEILSQTVRNMGKSGQLKYVDLFEVAIPLPDGSLGVLSIANDISDRISYEEELIRAKEEAEKSDRLKTEFLAQVSHEIRTPINTILNYSSLLKMEVHEGLSEDNAGSFDSIETAAKRLMRTIDLVLNVSEIETDSYDPVFKEYDLHKEIISPIRDEFFNLAKSKGLEFNIINELSEKTCVLVDQYTLTQIIINLVDNAIKYTPKGSVGIKLSKSNDNILIDVSDTGIGIAAEYIPKLFTKFSQEEQGYTRRYEGNGLGLALVRGYCKINKAEISVESEKGKGSKFTITLNSQTPVKKH